MFHYHSFRPSTFFFKFSSSFSCLLFSSLKANLLAFFSTLRSLRSSLIACFRALLSSLLSLLERGWVDILGRSLLLIICTRSTCFAVSPFLGKTLRGIPVLEDSRICLGANRFTIPLFFGFFKNYSNNLFLLRPI